MTGKHRVYPAGGSGFLASGLRRLFHSPERIVGRYVNPGDTVLDLGCGPGFFTIPLARMVGDTGTIIAVDVQEEMLGLARQAAEKEGLTSRIRFHRSSGDSLDLAMDPVVSFALAFHVMHETGNQSAILAELYRILRPGGLLLLAEPVGIVGRGEFEETRAMAREAGFREVDRPFILLSRAVLLEKSP